MRLPKKLTIAGHTITIEYRKKLVVDSRDCWGMYDDSKHKIYLTMKMDPTRKAEILLHEALHCISDIHLLNLSEKAVKILGIEILALIKNNKLNFAHKKKKSI